MAFLPPSPESHIASYPLTLLTEMVMIACPSSSEDVGLYPLGAQQGSRKACGMGDIVESIFGKYYLLQ